MSGRAQPQVLPVGTAHQRPKLGYTRRSLRGAMPMAEPSVRRADFLMALAYATDLATGHSRDFALRSCVLAMRMADVAGLDEPTRRAHLSSGAAALHRMQCRHATCWRRPGATRSRCAASFSASTWATGRSSSRSSSAPSRATSPGAPPDGAGQRRSQRGLAEAPQVNIPILSGHCEVAQRIAERIGLPDEIRESLGQIYERWDGKGMPRGLSGNAVKFPVRLVTLAQDAIALTRGSWIRDHEGDDRQARRRRLRARAGRSFPRPRRTVASRDSTGPSIARRSWRWSPSRTRCSTRRPARKPIWRSPT